MHENSAFHEFRTLKSRLGHVFQQQELLIPISTAFSEPVISVGFRCGMVWYRGVEKDAAAAGGEAAATTAATPAAPAVAWP